MLRQMLLCAGIFTSVYIASLNPSGAAEYGTPEEAQVMLKRAVLEVKKDKFAAIQSFNHNAPPFRDRDLFVFCFNRGDGRFTAHEAFVAHDVRGLHDAYGAPFGAEIYGNARDGEVIEIAFISPIPGSTELAVKSAHVAQTGDQVCGVSAYQADSSGKSIKIAQHQRW